MTSLRVAIVAILAATGVSAAGDEALLPSSGDVPGWERSAPARVFSGQELYGHINGGSEIFLEFGFQRVTVQRYRNGGDELVLEAYRMEDAAAALGVYLGKCGVESPDPGLAVRHTVGRFQLQAVRGPFYLVADNLSGKTAHVPALLAMVRAALAAFPPDEAVPAALLLADERLVPGSLRLLRGPVALEAIASLGDGNVLGLGRTTLGAAGRRAIDGTARIVVAYADEEDAARALVALAERRDPASTVVSRAARLLVMRDHSGAFTAAAQIGARVRIDVGLAAPPG